MPEERLPIETRHGTLSAVWGEGAATRAAMVVGHGAGAGMDDPLLVGFCGCLNEAQIATLRFNFPYREKGRRGPDPEPTLRGASLAAFEEARSRAGGKRVFAGGKSLGGRIASLLAADGMAAAGLVFLGYPLHPPGKPERLRDQHLYRVKVPMLFLQGTADPFARFDLMKDVTGRLGRWAVLHPVQGGDHSFRVRGAAAEGGEIGRLLGSVAARFIQSTAV